MNVELTQSEFEDLSAFFDGRLEGQEAARVRNLVATSDAWKKAFDELSALDRALDSYTVPSAPADLAGRIIAASLNQRRRSPLIIRLVKVLAPAAAVAAAILVTVSLYVKFHQQPSNTEIARQGNNDQAQVDELVIENLDFFKSYESLQTISHNEAVVDAATLSALDRLETREGT